MTGQGRRLSSGGFRAWNSAIGSSQFGRRSMQLRRLGRTDLMIAPMVLGGNVFGWTADKATSFAVLDRFAAAGLQRRRHGRFLFRLGPRPSWRRIGDHHRRVDESARKPQPHDRRSPRSARRWAGARRAFRRATSRRRSKRRSGACRPTSSTSICRTGRTWRRPSPIRSAPISG